MELVMGGLISACLAYLIGEVNQIQKDLNMVLIKVAVLELSAKNKEVDLD